MEDLNNVPSSGTYGAAINEVNANFSLIVNAINSLEYATTHSKGIYNNGFTPNTTTLPNSVSGDWCMVLGTGNTFPATIWTFNGTTWSQGGQWNPDGLDLTGYATTAAMNTAIANSLLQATARMGYGEATASNNAYSVTIANYTLPTNGGSVRVKMPTAATGAATLNITETGAKTIWYNGAAVSSQNTWAAQEIISVFYDGTKYMSSNSQGGGGDAEKIKYDNSQSGLSSTDVQGAIDEVDENIADLNEVVNDRTEMLGNELFNLANQTVGTNNTTYITPSKSGDTANWLVKKTYSDAGRIGTITFPTLTAGKTYRISFDYVSSVGNGCYAAFCDNNNSNIVRINGASIPNGSGSIVSQFVYSTVNKILFFRLEKPQALNNNLAISNISIKESTSLKDVVIENTEELEVVEEHTTSHSIGDGSPDFAICDNNGNAIVKFEDGHIKTKHFNSQTNSSDFKGKFSGKKISFLGDSITTFQGYLVSDKSGYDGSAYAYWYSSSKEGLNQVSQTWWNKLINLGGFTLANNCAWSGSTVTGSSTSTTNAHIGVSTRRVTDLGYGGVTPDVIIILIGINDLGTSYNRQIGTWTPNDKIPAEGTLNTFREAYALMVKKVLTSYPNAEVYCCTLLDAGKASHDDDDSTEFPTKNATTGCTVGMFNNAIREIAYGLGAEIIEMHECGITYFNLNTYTIDRLHPNANGATLMARKAYSELVFKSKLVME